MSTMKERTKKRLLSKLRGADDRLVDLTEAAYLLDYASRLTLYQAIRMGTVDIPTFKDDTLRGTPLFVRMSDIEAYLAERNAA